MAATDLDTLLATLKAEPAGDRLDGMEAGVWNRVERARRAQADGSGVQMQLAVAVAALLVGAVVGGVSVGHPPARNEAVVLSEDAGLAPSMAVEGGA